MQFENTVLLEEDLSTVYNNLTDPTNIIWRTDLKKVVSMDSKHFMEYNLDNYPTFFTIIKKSKNKQYQLEFVNNEAEGTICYKLQEKENKTEITVSLDVKFTEKKENFWFKNQWKRKWKKFVRNIENVGK